MTTTSEHTPTPKAAADDRPATHDSGRWLALGERLGLAVLLAGIIVYFSIRYSDTFATTSNWQTIATSQSVNVLIALALMVPLLSNNFDLSVGSTASLTAMVAAGSMSRHGYNLLEAALFILAIGLGIGLVNGLLVTRFGLNGLIATLGTATIIDAVLTWYSNSQSISSGFSTGLVNFGTDTVWGVPWLTVVALLAALVVGYVISQTPLGRRLVAIGSSGQAARLVGVRVDRLVLLSYVASGAIASMAGLLLLAQQGSASPTSSGIATLLPALAAVYLGASTWTPGQFNVVGTLLGLLLVAVTVSGLTLSGAAPWVNGVCYGAALVLAVGASAAFRRKRRGS